MSADSWDECPRCQTRQDAALVADKEKFEQRGYGIMPQEEWLALKEKIEHPPFRRKGHSLKEYHEQGLFQEQDGSWKYYVRYSGSCITEGCGFKIEKKIDEAIPVEEG